MSVPALNAMVVTVTRTSFEGGMYGPVVFVPTKCAFAILTCVHDSMPLSVVQQSPRWRAICDVARYGIIRHAINSSTQHPPHHASIISESKPQPPSRHSRCSAQARASGLAGAKRAKTHSRSTRTQPRNLAALRGKAAERQPMKGAPCERLHTGCTNLCGEHRLHRSCTRVGAPKSEVEV